MAISSRPTSDASISLIATRLPISRCSSFADDASIRRRRYSGLIFSGHGSTDNSLVGGAVHSFRRIPELPDNPSHGRDHVFLGGALGALGSVPFEASA